MVSIDDRLFVANATTGMVESYAIAPSGALTHLGDAPTGGTGPTVLSFSTDTSQWLFAANGGGNVTTLPRQMNPSLHPTTSPTCSSPGEVLSYYDPNHPPQFAWVPCSADDTIAQYVLQNDGSLAPNTPATVALPSGAGPRQIGRSFFGLFVLEAGTSTIAALTPDVAGHLTVGTRVSTRATNATGANVAAQIDGTRVLNIGDDDIVTFGGALKEQSRLRLAGAGPRSFASVDGFLAVANHDANEVALFSNAGATWQRNTAATVTAPTLVIATSVFAQ